VFVDLMMRLKMSHAGRDCAAYRESE